MLSANAIGSSELEQPETALEREIFEETRLKVHITRLARAIFDKKPTRVELVFTGTIVDGKFNPSAEITDLMYCSIDEWPDGMPNDQKKLIKEILAKP